MYGDVKLEKEKISYCSCRSNLVAVQRGKYNKTHDIIYGKITASCHIYMNNTTYTRLASILGCHYVKIREKNRRKTHQISIIGSSTWSESNILCSSRHYNDFFSL